MPETHTDHKKPGRPVEPPVTRLDALFKAHPDIAERVARAAGINEIYLGQLARGKRKMSTKTASRIVKEITEEIFTEDELIAYHPH